MSYKAKIVLDSVSECGDRLTTMEIRFPRSFLAEVNTHRLFTRNSASSRAIPFGKLIGGVVSNPFVPDYWGANQSGMQADKQIDEDKRLIAIEDWLKARDEAVGAAVDLDSLGVHKQTVNRLLEPFMWHTVIITATEWDNFFALRANPDAQPEIRTIAEMMQSLYEENDPQEVLDGQWHQPFIGITKDRDEYKSEDAWLQAAKNAAFERQWAAENPEDATKVSIARCARVSYLTHDGKREISADLTLYDRLENGGHLSPFEHVARPFTGGERRLLSGMTSALDNFADTFDVDDLFTQQVRQSLMFCGNFRGWRQARKMMANEAVFMG